MPDPSDVASDTEQFFNDLTMHNHRQAAKKHAALLNAFSGACLNCDEPVEGARYCDEFCQEDHEKRLRQRARAGRV